MHALLLCSLVCLNKSVCSPISSTTLKSETVFAGELSRLDCAYSNATCLCNAWAHNITVDCAYSKYHMLVQCMSSQHHSGLCLQQIPHVSAMHELTTSQWIVPTAMPHVCAMHTLPKWTAPAATPQVCAMHTLKITALSWWTCFRQPVVFVGCFVDFFFLSFFLQSFLLVQTQPALQSPPKSKGGKQPVADNKRNTTQH